MVSWERTISPQRTFLVIFRSAFFSRLLYLNVFFFGRPTSTVEQWNFPFDQYLLQYITAVWYQVDEIDERLLECICMLSQVLERWNFPYRPLSIHQCFFFRCVLRLDVGTSCRCSFLMILISEYIIPTRVFRWRVSIHQCFQISISITADKAVTAGVHCKFPHSTLLGFPS